MMPSRRSSRHAFTLLEVLVAIALLLALMGSIYAFTRALAESRARVFDVADRQLGATILIERLEADLMTSLVGDSKVGAGVAGDASSIRILSRGVAASIADRGLADPNVLGDLQRSEFRFAQGRHVIEGRKGPMGPGQSLSEPFWPLGSAHLVRFRYHDGSGWRDSFDSLSAGRLPRAIEVAVWFRPWPGQIEEPPEDGIPESTRLTFDTTDDVFDEEAYRDASAFAILPPPAPDRVRVIVIPDADADDGGSPEYTSPVEAGP